MSKRMGESKRLWFVAALFFVMVILIGWSFGRAIHDINVQTLKILEDDSTIKHARGLF